MPQIASFLSRPGKSTKNTPSNLSARANSGGNLEASLQVPTKKTSEGSDVKSDVRRNVATVGRVWQMVSSYQDWDYVTCPLARRRTCLRLSPAIT